MKLRKPKRSDFSERGDFRHALQVWALVVLAMEHGAPEAEVRKVLEEHDGGFVSWDFLWAP